MLALASSRLVDGSWDVPDDAPFAYVELRLFDGIREGTQTDPRSLALYAWGPGGAPLDDRPTHDVTELAVTLAAVSEARVGGTVTARVAVLGDAGGVLETRTFEASFEAVPGDIPPP